MVRWYGDPHGLPGSLGELPLLGVVALIGLTMTLSAVGWALIHTNPLPMVIDMTTMNQAGTYIGLY